MAPRPAVPPRLIPLYYTDNTTSGEYSQAKKFISNPDGPTLLFPLPGSPGIYLDVGNANDAGGDDGTVTGYTMADWLVGGTGFDILKGMEGDDIQHGESDEDWVYGGAGNDVFVLDDAGYVIIETSAPRGTIWCSPG